jgi:hypothetical protein
MQPRAKSRADRNRAGIRASFWLGAIQALAASGAAAGCLAIGSNLKPSVQTTWRGAVPLVSVEPTFPRSADLRCGSGWVTIECDGVAGLSRHEVVIGAFRGEAFAEVALGVARRGRLGLVPGTVRSCVSFAFVHPADSEANGAVPSRRAQPLRAHSTRFTAVPARGARRSNSQNRSGSEVPLRRSGRHVTIVNHLRDRQFPHLLDPSG